MTTCCDKAQALVDVVSFDVLVLDVRPRGPGAALLESQRATTDGPAIVTLIGEDSERVWRWSTSRGAHEVVHIGEFRPRRLTRAVALAAERRAAERAAEARLATARDANVALRRANEQLELAVCVDPLTSCLNRRGLSSRLAADVVAGVGRWQAILIDLDDLKAVNDRLGYRVGDATLARVGMALRRACRGTDHVGRLGGDEFLVLMPDATACEAQDLAEAAMTAVRRDEISVVDRQLSAVAAVAECARDATLEQILEQLHALARGGNVAESGHRVALVREGDSAPQLRCRWIHGAGRDDVVGAVLDGYAIHEAPQFDPLASPTWTATVASLSAHLDVVVALPDSAMRRSATSIRSLTVGVRSDLRWTVRLGHEAASDRRWVQTLRNQGLSVAVGDAGHDRATLRSVNRARPDLVCIGRRFSACVSDDPMAASVVRMLRAIADGTGARLLAEEVPDAGAERMLQSLGVRLFVRPSRPRVVQFRAERTETYDEASTAEGA